MWTMVTMFLIFLTLSAVKTRKGNSLIPFLFLLMALPTKLSACKPLSLFSTLILVYESYFKRHTNHNCAFTLILPYFSFWVCRVATAAFVVKLVRRIFMTSLFSNFLRSLKVRPLIVQFHNTRKLQEFQGKIWRKHTHRYRYYRVTSRLHNESTC